MKYPAPTKPRLFISFSGGRTSAYMTYAILNGIRERGEDIEVAVVFSNTGLEHPKTLDFIHECETRWGIPIVWIEAVTDPERGKGVRAKVVTYEIASRDGAPFRDAVAKHGIPNQGYPWCSKELKLATLTAYLRSIGWGPGTYDTAIGIRADEADRVAAGFRKKRIVYPLIRMGVRKPDILAWWAKQPFDLGIPEHYGNCVTCWKKSLRKLVTIARELPEAFEWNRQMERDHCFAGNGYTGEPRKFFRGERNTDDIFTIAARREMASFVDEGGSEPEFDFGAGCGESCEVWTDEVTDEGIEGPLSSDHNLQQDGRPHE